MRTGTTGGSFKKAFPRFRDQMEWAGVHLRVPRPAFMPREDHAGVHAKGQVIHFLADWSHGEQRLLTAVNSQLPRTSKAESWNRPRLNVHGGADTAKPRRLTRNRRTDTRSGLPRRGATVPDPTYGWGAMQDLVQQGDHCGAQTFSSCRRRLSRSLRFGRSRRLQWTARGSAMRFMVTMDRDEEGMRIWNAPPFRGA